MPPTPTSPSSLADETSPPFLNQPSDATNFLLAQGHVVYQEPPSERRRKPRVPVTLPALVRGSDSHGARFVVSPEGAQLQDLSSNGLSLFLKHPVKLGQRLFILFPSTLDTWAGTSPLPPSLPTTSIAVIGTVRRCQEQDDASCHVGIEFIRHRFVFAT